MTIGHTLQHHWIVYQELQVVFYNQMPFFQLFAITSSNIKFQFLMHLIFQCPHIIEILFFYLQFFISVQVLSPDF